MYNNFHQQKIKFNVQQKQSKHIQQSLAFNYSTPQITQENSMYPKQTKQIYLNIKTQRNPYFLLVLTPQNYKQQFKNFIKANNITKKQANCIKQLIIKTVKQKAQQQRQRNLQKAKVSPSFNPIEQNVNEQEISSINYQIQQEAHEGQHQSMLQKLSAPKEQSFSVKQFSSSNEQYIKAKLKDSAVQTASFIQQEQGKIYQLSQSQKNQQKNPNSKIRRQDIHSSDMTQKLIQKPHNNRLYEKKSPDQIFYSSNMTTPPKKYFLLQNYTKKKHFQNLFNQSNSRPIQQKPTKSKSKNKQKLATKSISPSKKSHHNILSTPVKNKFLQHDINEDQKQLNHKIFFRLNRTLTSSFRQKSTQQINRKQQHQYEEIQRFKELKESKYKYNSQVFNKLYLTSTESSFNRQRKQSPEKFSSSDMEIENVINNIDKSNKQSQKRPNMKSNVYNPSPQKRCNCHCQKFQYEKQLQKQKLKLKEKEKQIRKNAKQRDYSSSPKSLKKSGQCQFCHHQKIQALQRKKYQEYKKSLKRKPNYSAKSPNLKINFISDVLEESYQELFAQNHSNHSMVKKQNQQTVLQSQFQVI